MTQYINCAFKEGQRAYLYANDGEPVGVGEWVDVEAKHGGVRSVIVVEIDCEAPQQFVAKPIIGKTARKEDALPEDAEHALRPAEERFADMEDIDESERRELRAQADAIEADDNALYNSERL